MNVLLYTVSLVDKYRHASLWSSLVRSSLCPSLSSQKIFQLLAPWSPFNIMCRYKLYSMPRIRKIGPNSFLAVPYPAVGLQSICHRHGALQNAFQMHSWMGALQTKSEENLAEGESWLDQAMLILHIFITILSNVTKPTETNCSFCL